MKEYMKTTLFRVVCACMVALAVASCEKDRHEMILPSSAPKPGVVHVSGESRNVFILYSAGYNTLHSDLVDDIDELAGGYLPGPGRNDNVVLVLSHTTSAEASSGAMYSTPNPPVLVRLYCDPATHLSVRDTVKVFGPQSTLTDTLFMRSALEYIRDEYPALSYGMVFTSHAQGWVPPGYFMNNGGDSFEMFKRGIGITQNGSYTRTSYEEMDIRSFARAIPMHLDYLLVDACLMGGIEFAYELKDKVDLLSVSPTEVMSEGYDYKTMGRMLVGGRTPDCVGVCRSYFEQYSLNPSQAYQNATITLIDCRELEHLARACAPLFEKYRERIALTDPDRVQRYFRYGKHWFYDLEDILVAAGMTEEEKKTVDDAFDRCMVYRDHTSHFLEIVINTYCGLSTYLPSYGSAELDRYYRTLSWNKATSFVK